MYILDTNVISELRKQPAGRCDQRVARWADGTDLATTYLSAITVLEIELGVLQVARRDGPQGNSLRVWFDDLLELYDQRVIPLDTNVAMVAASLHVPDPKPDRDAVIAASGKVHGFTVVTRNIADFSSTGVALLNPWE